MCFPVPDKTVDTALFSRDFPFNVQHTHAHQDKFRGISASAENVGSCALVPIDASCRKSVKRESTRAWIQAVQEVSLKRLIEADFCQVGEVGCREMTDNFAN